MISSVAERPDVFGKVIGSTPIFSTERLTGSVDQKFIEIMKSEKLKANSQKLRADLLSRCCYPIKFEGRAV